MKWREFERAKPQTPQRGLRYLATLGQALKERERLKITFPRVERHTVAYYLERSPHVISYVKNDHSDFVIPYELYGVRLNYLPDYLVRLRRNNASAFNLILEVKGFESEPDRAKETSAQRWVRGVNHHGGFGRWELTVCREPHRLGIALAKLSPEEPRG